MDKVDQAYKLLDRILDGAIELESVDESVLSQIRTKFEQSLGKGILKVRRVRNVFHL